MRMQAAFNGWQGGLRFPTASTTGANLGALTTVGTGYLTSGPGWSWSSAQNLVNITGANANFTGYDVQGGANVKNSGAVISGCRFTNTVAVQSWSNTLIDNCEITTSGGAMGIQLQNGATYTTIQNCTIHGADSGANRMVYGVQPVGVDPALLIQGCNIYWTKVCVPCPEQTSGSYTIQHNYLHDMGYTAGDHTEPLTIGDGTATGLIYHNTMFNQLGQTAVCAIGNTQAAPANITVKGNLMAGGSYVIYWPAQPSSYGNGTYIQVTENYFSTRYYPNGGQFGYLAFYDGASVGNLWANNRWLDGPNAGQLLTAS